MNSEQKDLFRTAQANGINQITLQIRGLIPSFKNNKMLITKSPNGKPLDRPLLITKPEFQKVMKQMVDSFVSQCLCAFRTAGGPTFQESSIRSLTVSSLPADDCWEKIPQIVLRGGLCAPGEEGATVIIERL